jgi:hypothetical protein
MGSLARRPVRPGDSLSLLPAAADLSRAYPSWADLSWADGQPRIAEAMVRAVAAVEAAAAPVVSDGVRQLVETRLADWSGAAPGLDTRPWLDEPTAVLPEAERPAGRLALLTAFASHRVTDSVVDDFRRHHPGDGTLVAFTSWVSLTAARQIGSRLHAACDIDQEDAV